MPKERYIIIPRNLTSFSSVANLELRSLDLHEIDRCILDFTGTHFAEPLPMMSLASDLRDLRTRFPAVTYLCNSKDTAFRGYADHIGYFRFLGFSRGNLPGDVSGSGNYVPIHLFNIDKIKEASGDEPYGKIVSEESVKLAEVLAQDSKSNVFVALEYAIREILRNAVEHGMGSKAAMLAQYWPKKHEAEVVICDNGLGIVRTLEAHHAFSDSYEALELSLNAGVSGTSELERQYQNPYYRNSGFGLYTTSTLCAKHGSFRIISGDAGLSRQSENLKRHKWSFDGTCVQMKLRTNELSESRSTIQKIIEVGETGLGKPQSASTASKQTSGWN
ncbi:ATP-binding protein [Ruegeria litorea]|uniref:ATP-binding protein n=1 Tax=Falsiruegeria litorea TaxID=1280831 RepID=A0ABS5WQG3_9RHOB|nr:ATP-binding protein [Falsiruegeria litorea]MBT3141372.1 ATP-binding protein [Falsiruegeria litorea]